MSLTTIQSNSLANEIEDIKAIKANLRSWWKSFAKRKDNDTTTVPIFGVPLKQSLKSAHVQISTAALDSSNHLVCGFVPVVVAKCGLRLKESATEVEGTFRVSGSSKRMKDLQTIFESAPKFGKNLDWNKHSFTSHDVASVLRRYLTSMPEPVIPLEFYHDFRSVIKNIAVDSEAITAFQNLIVKLPGANQCLLLYVLDLLAVFDRKSQHNKMNAFNLALIFQPGLISHPKHDQSPDELKLSQETLEFLIKHQDHFLFALTSKTQPKDDKSENKDTYKLNNNDIILTPTDSDEDTEGGWKIKRNSSMQKSNSSESASKSTMLSRSKTSYWSPRKSDETSHNNRTLTPKINMTNIDNQSTKNDERRVSGDENKGIEVGNSRGKEGGDLFANSGASIMRRATAPTRRHRSSKMDGLNKGSNGNI